MNLSMARGKMTRSVEWNTEGIMSNGIHVAVDLSPKPGQDRPMLSRLIYATSTTGDR